MRKEKLPSRVVDQPVGGKLTSFVPKQQNLSSQGKSYDRDEPDHQEGTNCQHRRNSRAPQFAQERANDTNVEQSRSMRQSNGLGSSMEALPTFPTMLKSLPGSPSTVRLKRRSPPSVKPYANQLVKITSANIATKISKNASCVFHVMDRRINLDNHPSDASVYALLRSWVQDDPHRDDPSGNLHVSPGGPVADSL